jgi:hypothetical protein
MYLRDLPRLAHTYGLKPWELEDLKPSELAEFVTALPMMESRGNPSA